MTRIDSVSSNADRLGRFLVKFSDGSHMKLYRQTVEDFRLYPGLELSEETLDAIRESAGSYSAKMRAVRIVSAASVSKGDLESRLVRKGESPQQAREAVEWMADLNLLDDARTARQIAQSAARKGYGLARAKQALYEKRIPKEYWDEVLADYPDQMEAIVKLLRAKLADPDDPKQVKRAVDAALRRGHSYGEVKRALSVLGSDSEQCMEDYE